MKRVVKSTAMVLVLMVLGGGCIFAQPKKGRNNMRIEYSRNQKHMNGIGSNYKHAGIQKNVENAQIIGKIKSVDVSDSKMIVTNSDNKDTKIVLSAFTSIFDTDRNEVSISDIKNYSEVMIFAFNTETEIPVASRIILSK